jgi:hypothetical protein
VAYYLTAAGSKQVAARIADTLEPSGHLVAVHYRGPTSYPRTGDAVHEMLRRELHGWTRVVGTWVEASFRIDVFERSAS